MLRLSAARVGRSLHTGPVSFQFVRDVYKKIDYSIEFKDVKLNYRYQERRDDILDQLNTLDARTLELFTTKKFSKAIVGHRNQNGEFDCAEQLLDIESVEQHQIEKLVEKFLVNPTEELEWEKEMQRKVKESKKRFNKDIVPKPDLDDYIENSSFTGIHLSQQGISFAKISNGSLVDWKAWDFKEDLDFDPTAKTSYMHNNLFAISKKILHNFEIARSDYMIFDESPPLLSKDPYFKSKISQLKLRTTLMTMLMMQDPGSKFHAVKSGVFDEIVNLKQGNERVSVRDKFFHDQEGECIIPHSDSEDNEDREESFSLGCCRSLWENYFMEKRSVEKEMLLLAMLRAACFEKLCRDEARRKKEKNKK